MNIGAAVKTAIVISALGALALPLYLTGELTLALVLFVGAAGATWLSPRVATFALLTTLYWAPAISLIALGRADPWTDGLWQAALAGLLVASPGALRWSMPSSWRVALGTWALTAALCWPVIALREVDFSPALFATGEFSKSIIAWAPLVAASHMLGVLWFDALFAADRDVVSFDRAIAWPLAAGAGAAGIVALYQQFGAVGFLNPTVYAYFHRATGTMADGNVYGTVAAMWICGFLVLLARARRRFEDVLFGAGAALSALGCWASGSRSALLAAIVGLVVAAVAMWRRRAVRLTFALPAAVGAILVALALPGHAAGPIARFTNLYTSASAHPLRAMIAELWNRNWYGTVADWMIARWPLTGVGVGSFNALAPPVADLIGHGPLPPDNAQNWFRHQLAEFGVLGCAGWIATTVLLIRLFISSGFRRGWHAAALAGSVLGVGLASMVGMPTQAFAVLLTFWTFVYWYGFATERPTLDVAEAPRVSRWWAWGVLAAVVCAGATGYASWTSLRPPLRALRFGLDYDYGFYDPETDAAGHTFRWTRQHAVVVLPASAPWVKLTFSVNHSDVERNPVAVTIRKDAGAALSTVLDSTAPVTAFLHTPDGHRRIMIETSVSRVVRPSSYGLPDDRDLGLMVAWDFVERPDAAARLIAAR